LGSLCDWLLERREAKSKEQYGARIKWRRLSLLLGTFALAAAAVQVVDHNLHSDPWDDVNTLIESVAGASVVVSREQGAVFKPLVETYGDARWQHMGCTVLGAALFVSSMALDIFGAGRECLRAGRLCGLFGTLAYVAGTLFENMPDYVGLLDFTPTLGKCGSEFCASVASSMRAALGSAFLAHSGAFFIPLLISLPWTLGRIGFFLAKDDANANAVAALTWGTLTCILRLSILPATVAFIYRPVPPVAWLYVVFLVGPSLFLTWVVSTKRTSLAWYFVWGWTVFLLPLLGMGSVALDESMWTLWYRIFRGLLMNGRWADTLAEFALSDVVISDMFFMIL
jgi:hypothetical protein